MYEVVERKGSKALMITHNPWTEEPLETPKYIYKDTLLDPGLPSDIINRGYQDWAHDLMQENRRLREQIKTYATPRKRAQNIRWQLQAAKRAALSTPAVGTGDSESTEGIILGKDDGIGFTESEVQSSGEAD